jgi:hypothetical protein
MAQSAPPRHNPARWGTVTVLLIAALGGALWVPIYARSLPKLGGFPFFYWYQLALVPVVAVVCWICYLLLAPTVPPEPSRPATRHDADAWPGRDGGVRR